MKRDIAIGTDIGGSYISCAAVNMVTGKILKETITAREADNQAQAVEIIGGSLIRFMNDASSFAVEEAWAGSAAIQGSAYLLDKTFWKFVQHALPLV